MIIRLASALVAAVALGFGATGTASADNFGSPIGSCGQTMLGQRPNPPVLTCSCDAMTFAAFGAMVQTMKA